ncbi:GGDEF domain-containing protein (plasmid) [Pseudoalteromonas espejiana]
MKQAKLILSRQKATIAIIDLDYFKQINDKFGHDIGDLVLIKFAQAAKDTLTNTDLFGRYGGEEWLFVLSTTDENIIKNYLKSLI